jgi:asparagine N-glycosylation enzyme membrane subunit Stt3
MFAMVISLIENKSVKESLKGSKALTKKKFWHLLLAMIIFNILTGIPKIILSGLDPTVSLFMAVFDPLSALFMILLYIEPKYSFNAFSIRAPGHASSV